MNHLLRIQGGFSSHPLDTYLSHKVYLTKSVQKQMEELCIRQHMRLPASWVCAFHCEDKTAGDSKLVQRPS